MKLNRFSAGLLLKVCGRKVGSALWCVMIAGDTLRLSSAVKSALQVEKKLFWIVVCVCVCGVSQCIRMQKSATGCLLTKESLSVEKVGRAVQNWCTETVARMWGLLKIPAISGKVI